MTIDPEDYVEKFKPSLMDVVYSWCNGSSFAQICKMTDVFEGKYLSALSLFFFFHKHFIKLSWLPMVQCFNECWKRRL